MSLLDTLIEAARYVELQESRQLDVKATVLHHNGALTRENGIVVSHLKEEPKSPLPSRVVSNGPVIAAAAAGVGITHHTNGVIRPPSPSPRLTPTFLHERTPVLDFEHSRPRATNHGPQQIPSPPSVNGNNSNSSNGSNTSGASTISNLSNIINNNHTNGNSNGNAPRAGTREVHNKLEKNRRAHLKECFDLLKKQLPATADDKKTSNLSILGSAIRYIQVLRRKERECEHEMERLARDKIAAQQRLAALRRDAHLLARRARAPPAPAHVLPPALDSPIDMKDRDDKVNGQLLGIPISITCSVNGGVTVGASGGTPLVTPAPHQVIRTSYGRNNTLTLTTLAPADTVSMSTTTQKAPENGVTNTMSTALMHPAQIHLPLSQMLGMGMNVGGGLVVGGVQALQVPLSALHLLQPAPNPAPPAPATHARIHGVSSSDNTRIPIENGIVTSTSSTDGAVSMGLTPLVVSQPQIYAHTLSHKMVETQVMKGSVAPLTVSAQYLSATTIMKPVVVVSSSGTPPSTSA